MKLRNKESGELGAKHTKFNAVTGEGFSLIMGKKKLIYLSVNVFSTKVLIWDTILCLQLETGPPFYVVIWDMPR